MVFLPITLNYTISVRIVKIPVILAHINVTVSKAIVDYLYTQSNLKDILDKENFSTCSLSYYSRNHIDPLTGRSSLESMETALNVCHNFVDTFSKEFHNILLYGDTGVGKTFLSHCIAKELMDSAYSVIYFTAAGL